MKLNNINLMVSSHFFVHEGGTKWYRITKVALSDISAYDTGSPKIGASINSAFCLVKSWGPVTSEHMDSYPGSKSFGGRQKFEFEIINDVTNLDSMFFDACEKRQKRGYVKSKGTSSYPGNVVIDKDIAGSSVFKLLEQELTLGSTPVINQNMLLGLINQDDGASKVVIATVETKSVVVNTHSDWGTW